MAASKRLLQKIAPSHGRCRCCDQPRSSGNEHVLTGHDNGLITLNVAEADSSDREKIRAARRTDRRTQARWLALSEASNSINRCMGLPDLYSFVISGVTADKLGFVHEVIGKAGPEHLRTAAA